MDSDKDVQVLDPAAFASEREAALSLINRRWELNKHARLQPEVSFKDPETQIAEPDASAEPVDFEADAGEDDDVADQGPSPVKPKSTVNMLLFTTCVLLVCINIVLGVTLVKKSTRK